jgi:protein-disulfide isomerase
MSFDDDSKIQLTQNKSKSMGLIIGLVIAVGAAAFFAGMYASNMNSNQISQEDLDDAIAKLELKILQNRLPTNQPSEPVKISADDDPIIGNPNAPITIIEFSDFQCPFCARFHVQTLPLLLEEYIEQGKVKLVFRDFPIQSIHPNALPAAVAAECANEQGQFKAMHDMLFDNQNQWSKQETDIALSIFSQYATEIQLDQNTFDSCLTSGKYIEEIRNDLEDGRSYDVTGTPGFFIGNDDIGYVELKGAQPFESFKKVIDAQLEA